MELFAFVNPTGVILAAWPHGGEQARAMSALLGTLRLEELPSHATGIRLQIAQRGWALLPSDDAKAFDLLGVLRPAGISMGQQRNFPSSTE